MSQLVGKVIRTEITGLDIVSDDGKHVLRVVKNGDTTQLVERDANDTPYGWQNRITYSLDETQKDLVAIAIRNGDAQYSKTALEKISVTQFQIEQPAPVEEPKEDCSPIAVADAQAAAALVAKEARIEAVQFEMRLDHTRDKHWSDVEGCPLCNIKVVPSDANKVDWHLDENYDAKDDPRSDNLNPNPEDLSDPF